MPRFKKIMKGPPSDRIFGGYVCGLAHTWGVQVFPLRLLIWMLAMMSPLVVGVFFVLMVINMPEYDKQYDRDRI